MAIFLIAVVGCKGKIELPSLGHRLENFKGDPSPFIFNVCRAQSIASFKSWIFSFRNLCNFEEIQHLVAICNSTFLQGMFGNTEKSFPRIGFQFP